MSALLTSMSRFSHILGAMVAAATLAAPSSVLLAAEAVATKPVTTKALRAADTFVRSGSAARRNYGTEKTMELRSANRDRVSEAYLQFNIDGFEPTLTNATLWIYAMLDQPGRVSGVVRSFGVAPLDELAVNWSNRPEHVSNIGRFEVTGVSPVWYQVDVTRYLQEQVAAGNPLASIALILAEEGETRIVVQSRESVGYQPELTATRPPFQARIQFLPEGSAPATDWRADHGKVFGRRANGLSYGWSYDVSKLSRDRAKSAMADVAGIKPPSRLHETFCPVDALGVQEQPKWEIAVPNGRYRVRMIVGDVEDAGAIYAMAAEGALVVSGLAGGTNRWFEGTASVDVADGRLTLTDHPRGSGNKLCAVEIVELETP